MNWSSESLYNKAKLFAQRAHDHPVESALFGFWMSLSLELLARAALAHIHPVLVADPKEPDNIQYAFGINPKGVPRSILSKAVFARCSVFVPDFTDKMSGECLIVAERRNAELHSGEAAFEGIDNSTWLPKMYEVFDILLKHLKRDFDDLLGEHAESALVILKDRRDSVKKEVNEKIAAARKYLAGLEANFRDELTEKADGMVKAWSKGNKLRLKTICPACEFAAGIGGETVGRSPAKVDESSGTITREVRVLPNLLRCPVCKLELNGFPEMNEASRGAMYSIEEEEDPITFFGIVPEEYIDIDALVQQHLEGIGEDYAGYMNE